MTKFFVDGVIPVKTVALEPPLNETAEELFVKVVASPRTLSPAPLFNVTLVTRPCKLIVVSPNCSHEYVALWPSPVLTTINSW